VDAHTVTVQDTIFHNVQDTIFHNETYTCYRCGSLSLATREDLGAGAGEVS
jgi:hypothetical protein